MKVQPSPVLELCYAFFRTVAPEKHHSGATLPWLRRLEVEQPDWLAAVREAFEGEGLTGFEPLLMACTLGYALDADTSRFLNDLPRLPEQMLHDLDLGARSRSRGANGRGEPRRGLRSNYEQLSAGTTYDALQRAMPGLWAALLADWEGEGESAARAASEELLRRAEGTGDLLSALPPHHFVSLETSVKELRSREAGVRIIVAPLYFAAMGGFKFEVGDAHYLGYGIRSERLFKKRQEQTENLAGRLRAFSDPTRLLLLVLISRLRRFPLTVGDLARQLGVSQPTASGHLKLLRDLELVEVVRRGNRSYYRVLREPISEALEELTELLLLRDDAGPQER